VTLKFDLICSTCADKHLLCYCLLQSTGLDQQLTAPSDPAYPGPQLPTQQFVLDLPWWFFGSQPAAAAAMPTTPASTEPTTPPPVGIPAQGPYTVSDVWERCTCFTPGDETAFDPCACVVNGCPCPSQTVPLVRPANAISGDPRGC
jgi:hypothetical protein